MTRRGHASALACLESAVSTAPRLGDAWAILAKLYLEEYTHGFNLQPDPVGRGMAAAT